MDLTIVMSYVHFGSIRSGNVRDSNHSTKVQPAVVDLFDFAWPELPTGKNQIHYVVVFAFPLGFGHEGIIQLNMAMDSLEVMAQTGDPLGFQMRQPCVHLLKDGSANPTTALSPCHGNSKDLTLWAMWLSPELEEVGDLAMALDIIQVEESCTAHELGAIDNLCGSVPVVTHVSHHGSV